MEIRLTISGFRIPISQIILAYKDSTWTVNRYKYQRRMLGSQIEVTRFDPDKFSTHLTLNTVFPILLANDILSLPGQEDLHIQPTVYDGVGYFILYKVKNKFRSYAYFNPEPYSEIYPEKKERIKIINIVKNINGLFQ
jgi:hypothetical protein